jgi:hypothetical protein
MAKHNKIMDCSFNSAPGTDPGFVTGEFRTFSAAASTVIPANVHDLSVTTENENPRGRFSGKSRDPASLISRNAALDPGFRRGDGVVERPVKYQEIGRLWSKDNNPSTNYRLMLRPLIGQREPGCLVSAFSIHPLEISI